MIFRKGLLDLAKITWKVNLINGVPILQGPHKYETIQRDNIKSFELYKKNIFFFKKIIFKVFTDGKTLVHRLKTTGQMTINKKQKNKIKERVRITALLKKNSDSDKNIKYMIKENNQIVQEYEIDPNESIIYYYRENKKIEIKNKFSNEFPYSPIKLRVEELLHLNA